MAPPGQARPESTPHASTTTGPRPGRPSPPARAAVPCRVPEAPRHGPGAPGRIPRRPGLTNREDYVMGVNRKDLAAEFVLRNGTPRAVPVPAYPEHLRGDAYEPLGASGEAQSQGAESARATN